ncbi:MAG: Mov34/MPN/PAD-1 family protein, partial [Candidatus Lokiarchaeota archaeon]
MLKGNKSNESIVKVKPDAYYKMLVHVLRFGAKTRNRNQFKEVMGMLIGHLEGEGEIRDVIIEDAVPVSHGGSIEVTFATEDYITFSAIDEQYAQKDWFTVGWYHSHPGLDIFFSNTDVRNQLGWQNANPSAIGIVFDHTYLDRPNDRGFRTFRLDDPSKGATSKYHEVETIIEPPDDITYYYKIYDLINSIHSKEPPVLELNETPTIFSSIIFPNEEDLRGKKPELNFESILNDFQNGMIALIINTIKPLLSKFNLWSQKIVADIIKNNILMKNDLEKIKNQINSELKKVQTSFKINLTNNFNQLDFFIDDKLETFDSDFEKIKEKTNLVKENLLQQIDQIFNDTERLIKENIFNTYNSQKNICGEVEAICLETKSLIESSFDKITDISEKNKETFDSLKLNSSNLKENNVQEISNNFKELEQLLSESVQKNDKISKIIKDMISILDSTKEPLENKLNSLQTDKKVLQNKLDKLNSELKSIESKLDEQKDQNKELEKEVKNLRNKNDNLNKKIKK